jgi:hypothetical protein
MRSFSSYYQRGQIKRTEVGGEYITDEVDDKCLHNFIREAKEERSYLLNLGVDDKVLK